MADQFDIVVFPDDPLPQRGAQIASTITQVSSQIARAGAAMVVILAAWQPAPTSVQSPSKLPPSLLAVQVDSPVQKNRQTVAAVLTAWQPAPPLPTLPKRLPPSALDVRVDAPPVLGASDHEEIISASWIVAPLPQIARKLMPQGGAAVVPTPPYSTAWTAALSWPAAASPPQLGGKLPPSLLDVPVNPAPPDLRGGARNAVYLAWLPVWQQPQRGAQLAPPTPISPQVDSPPGGNLYDVAVIDDFVLPQVSRKLAQPSVTTSVDAPPPDYRFRVTARLTWEAWLPPPPMPQLPEYVAQPPTNPVGNGVPVIVSTGDWTLPQRSPFVPTVATDVRVDSPVPQRGGAQRTVYDWWIPGPPAPQQSGHLPQGAPADAPPIRRGGEQRLVFDWWIPGPPLPQQSGKLVQPFVATSVDPPPVRRGGEQRVVFEYWRAPDPMPQLQGSLNASFEAISADNPPPNGGRSSLPAIIAAWTPVSTSQPARVLAPPPSAQVDNPPPQQNNWRRVVIESWQPAAPAPQRAKVQIIQGVSVDTAPFYRPWLRSVIEQWNIQPPHRQRWTQIVPVHTAPPVPVPGIRIVYVLEQDRIVIVPIENRTVVAVDPMRAVTSA